MNLTVHPAHILRSYTWDLLKTNQPNDWSTENYGGLLPIVPLNEEPKVSEYGGPYIVYGYAYDATGSLYARRMGSTTFAVYDDDDRRMARTLNTLTTAFERQDEAARDVNKYSGWKNEQFLGIRFGYILLGFVEGGSPEEEEGGRETALVNLRYEFYVDHEVTTDLVGLVERV